MDGIQFAAEETLLLFSTPTFDLYLAASCR
jgi:hypothetical protein